VICWKILHQGYAQVIYSARGYVRRRSFLYLEDRWRNRPPACGYTWLPLGRREGMTSYLSPLWAKFGIVVPGLQELFLGELFGELFLGRH
jgi:hypothetical protein